MNDLRNHVGERLDYTFVPGAPDTRRVVVIGHGVTSHKDRPWLIALSQACAQAGMASLRFSFSGNGVSEGRYEDSTISKEVLELRAVIDAFDGWQVIYAGHSMGGAVGVLATASDERIRAFVSLAGMVHVTDFMQQQFGHLEPDKDVMLEKPHCPLTHRFLEDAHQIGSVLDTGKRINVPWLIVHGTADDIVPIKDSYDVRDAMGERVELIELDGVDHRFTGCEEQAAEKVVSWLGAQRL